MERRIDQLVEEITEAKDNEDKTLIKLLNYQLMYNIYTYFDELSSDEVIELLTIVEVFPAMVTSPDCMFSFKNLDYKSEYTATIEPTSEDWYETPREALFVLVDKTYSELSGKIN